MKPITKSIKIHVLSDTLSTQNFLKQGDALPLLLFNFSLEYAIRKIKGNQAGLELNGSHQLLVDIDQVHLLRKRNCDNEKTETLSDSATRLL
jgi:hypothetical protein